MLAINIATSAWKASQQRQKENREVQQNRLRAGYNFNRSRIE